MLSGGALYDKLSGETATVETRTRRGGEHGGSSVRHMQLPHSPTHTHTHTPFTNATWNYPPTHTHTHTHTHTLKYTHTPSNKDQHTPHTHTHTQTQPHTHTHTHTHTHILTHRHTHLPSLVSWNLSLTLSSFSMAFMLGAQIGRAQLSTPG